MRTLITLISALSLSLGITACSKDASDADPCGRAIANAERLARENPTVSARYEGARPIVRAHCEGASSEQINCAAYASDWNELRRCSPDLVH
jgi:hypothetical protein